MQTRLQRSGGPDEKPGLAPLMKGVAEVKT